MGHHAVNGITAVEGAAMISYSIRQYFRILVGATGTGKSTLVDGMVNYILGVKWEDPFRFSTIDMEHEEKERHLNQVSLI